ncbi:hypothetical protein AOLI_G00259570 [Acnodon oligacanthus]
MLNGLAERSRRIAQSNWCHWFCTHIPIMTAVGKHEADYVNRKPFHSINVQYMILRSSGSPHYTRNSIKDTSVVC